LKSPQSKTGEKALILAAIIIFCGAVFCAFNSPGCASFSDSQFDHDCAITQVASASASIISKPLQRPLFRRGAVLLSLLLEDFFTVREEPVPLNSNSEPNSPRLHSTGNPARAAPGQSVKQSGIS